MTINYLVLCMIPYSRDMIYFLHFYDLFNEYFLQVISEHNNVLRFRLHWQQTSVNASEFCCLGKENCSFKPSTAIIKIFVDQCAAENEFLDVIAHATAAGEILIYSSHFAVMDCDDKKLRKSRHVNKTKKLILLFCSSYSSNSFHN